MKSCGNCSKEIKKGQPASACKCGSEIFCSSTCYYTATDHRKICPAHKKAQAEQFSSPFVSPSPESSSSSSMNLGIQLQKPVEEEGVLTKPVEEGGVLTKPAELDRPKHPGSTSLPNSSTAEDIQRPSDNLVAPGPVKHAQKRNAYGQFQENRKDPVKIISEAQKERNKIFANVTKWKKTIEEHVDKIQAARPEVSQLYVLESNIVKGNGPWVIRRTGINTAELPPPIHLGESQVGEEAEEEPSDLVESIDQIMPIEVSDEPDKTPQRRPANLYCYICKHKVGPDNKLRITCVKKDCFRSAAHLACLNMHPTSDSAMTTIRIAYMCPTHRAPKVVETSRFGSQQGEVAGSVDSAGPEPVEIRPEPNPGKRNPKNNNFQVPQKLSPLLMEVLKTDQRYLNVNEIRKLVRAYKNQMNLKEENQLIVPDRALAAVTGSQPFKLTQIISVLQKHKSISK